MIVKGNSSPCKTVREHIPLEQGLRLLGVASQRALTTPVREHIPLEQGLRQV